MTSTIAVRFVRTAALLAPFVVSGVPGPTALTAHAQARPDAPADTRTTRVAPGRVVFAINATGAWQFGARGARLLVDTGSVVVYTTGADNARTEVLNSATGTKSLLPPGGIDPVQEGARGGERYPSSRADDDRDGRIDEDPLDGIDNDGDGKIDEDFAAIGDAMAVVKYAPAVANGVALAVRHEVYAWTLPHIDRMVASTIFVRNAGIVSIPGIRVGVMIAPGEAIADNRMLARTTRRANGEFATANVLLRGSDESLAALLFAQSRQADAEWHIRDDGESVLAVSPDLGDLAPGATVVIHLALLAAPADETQATRAVQAARRTVLGEGSARMIPPPVSLSSQLGGALVPSGPGMEAAAGAPPVDAFWLSAGKLEEILLGGSPNPFRDAITVEYEIPTHAIDEDGVEHMLSGAAVPTSVKVYNVTGRLIATLIESTHAPGRYRTGWTAQTDEGGAVASGVYYVKLTIGKRSVTKRLVQIK